MSLNFPTHTVQARTYKSAEWFVANEISHIAIQTVARAL